LVAVARSILLVVWQLLADPIARYRDLCSDFYLSLVNNERRSRQLVHQLEALGYRVTLQPTPIAA
jgi:transposase